MKTILRLFFMLAASLLVTTAAQAACTTTLSTGSNVATAVSSAVNGSTICLNAGNYGTVNLFNIQRSGFVTIQSVSGKTAVIAPQVGNSSYIRMSSLSIAGALQNSCSRNIEWVGNTVTEAITLTNSGCSGSLATVFDGNTFGSMGATTYEGRLSLIYGSGITVKNNTFGPAGASDGIFMGGNVSNVDIGPNNKFTGIQEALCGTVHCDAIQGYGAGSGISIHGNLFEAGDTFIMMPDGSSGVSVTNNVFNGNAVSYIDKIQFGSASSPVFQHNTLLNVRASFDSKSGSAATSNALVENNVVANGSSFKMSGGSGCSSCTFRSNMFNSSSLSNGSSVLIGTPIFSGGSAPTTLAGFALASNSPGRLAASDGTDLGAIISGSTAVATLAPPTNVTVH
jgi:hypothetical protein